MAIEQLLDESDLLKKIAYGNQAAFETLFKHYHQKVFAFGRKITCCDEVARELVQEIFLKLWQRREAFLTIDNFGPYLNKMVRNHCLNIFRKLSHHQKYKKEILHTTLSYENTTQQDLYYRDVKHRLNIALMSLSPNQRMAYMLCHQEGLKYKEAAQKMNISVQTLHEYVKIALRKIRSQLNPLYN